MRGRLNALLNPESLAVVGASPLEGKAGNIILKQAMAGDLRVYAVNAKGDTVHGLPIYRGLHDLPEVPDLAVLALPAEATVAAADECARRGVGALIAVASGFGETGEGGRALERELEAAIHGSRTRLLGPNTLGVLVPGRGPDTLFLPPDRLRRPNRGTVALISQSGSAALGELDAAAFYGATISAFVGLGNRLDVDENELLDHFAADPTTSVIALYLESFADAAGFLKKCQEIVPRKPIALLKAGRSEAGARAVQLHTGSLAGSDRVTDGALRQVGVLRVYDAEELIDTARALAHVGRIEGRRVAVLTNGGGFGIVAADYIEAMDRGIGSRLASLAPETIDRLSTIAVPYAALRNPIDLTASLTNETCEAALEILQGDPGVDVILCCLGYQPPAVDSRLTGILCHWGRNGRKPLVVALMGSEMAIQGMREMEAAGVACFPTVWRAVRAIDALARRDEHLRRAESAGEVSTSKVVSPPTGPVLYQPGIPLAEDQVKAILRDRGISTPRSAVLAQGASLPGLSLSYPLVVKVRSAAILHKTERKGVVLGIRDSQELERVVGEMRSRFPGEDLLVEEMEAGGVEVIVGLLNDPTFGTSIMLGIGGILAELYRDVAFRRVPIRRADAEAMLSELKAGALFEGFRGIKASREAVIDLLLKVSQLGEELAGSIDQMDLNPVIVHEDRAVAVDAKLLWRQGSQRPRDASDR